MRLQGHHTYDVLDRAVQIGGYRLENESATLDQVEIDEVIDEAEHEFGGHEVYLEQFRLLCIQMRVAELLSRQDDGVQRRLNLMCDRRVQNLVDVLHELVLIDFKLLSRLLYHDNLRIPLLKPALLRLDLKVAIGVSHFDA